jgi:uncharacterized protein (DUF58 family)
MNLKLASQLFSFRDLRNALLGVFVVVGGLGLSGLTLYAHRIEEPPWLAAVAAISSLVFVLLILVFVVPPLARNAGREASQLNLPFEFTTGGAVLLVLILIVGFSAWNTGNNLLFLVLAFLIAAMVVAFFAGSLTLKRLDVTMRFPETIFAGEPTSILVGIRNRKRLVPAMSVVVEVRGRERESSVASEHLYAVFPRFIAKRLAQAPVIRRILDHFVHVPARDRLETKTEHIFPNRGRLAIRDFELSTKFPFGFFRHRRRLPAREAELIVFPRLIDLSPDTVAASLEAGQKPQMVRGGGQDLLALRGYQPMDDLRRIDWKATARSRQLIVREFAAEDQRRVTIFFDRRVDVRDPAEPPIREKIVAEQNGRPVVASLRFERGASLAASVLMHFAASGAETRLIIIGGAAGDFGIGRSHVHESLRAIAVAEPEFPPLDNSSEPSVDLERLIDESGDGEAILVTAARDVAVAPRLKILNF